MSWRLPIAPRLALATGVAALYCCRSWLEQPHLGVGPDRPQARTTPPPRPSRPVCQESGREATAASFSGTFSLKWQQSGKNLSGTIMISGFSNVPTSIHGTVQGASIRFGTVGSESITYSGSVSASSMSGTWKIQAGGRSLGGGSWKASKSS